MIWRIAVRNLVQHKAKTLVIGSLVALAIMLTLAGNSVIESMRAGITKSFTENFTGEILITSNEIGAGVFGAQTNDMFGPPVIPILKDYERALKELQGLPGLASFTNQMSGYTMLNFEEKGMDFALFFGVDPADYFRSMDNVRLIEGRRLESGEEGLMLNKRLRDEIAKTRGLRLKPGDVIQLNSFGDAGFKIREVPVIGVFEFKSANQRFFTPSFLDIRSLRVLVGRGGGPVEKVQVAKDATALLEADLDSLFSGEAAPAAPAAAEAGRVDEKSLYGILGGRSKKFAAVDQEKGAWNFILARLAPGVDPEPLINKLNETFKREDIDATAQGWQPSGAPDSYTFAFLGLVFNVAMGLLAFVSIIIIMNTLVISVMERTSEIGAMRALGAQKSFVRRMFVAETFAITLIFGGLGILLGAGLVGLLYAAGIPADNDFLAVIYGGQVLRPTVGLVPLLQALGGILAIGSIAWIYPVRLALKVSPLKAIATE